jgi:hypothetical protein
VDVRLAFHRCSSEQIMTYCRHFYGGSLSQQDAAALLAAVPPASISIAQLQAFFLCCDFGLEIYVSSIS